MSMEDKRQHRRKTLHTEAMIADVLGNTWSKVGLLDISVSGLAFLSPEAYATGSARMLRFELPDQTGKPHRLSVVCHIVHCAAHSFLTGYRIGAAFARMEAEDEQALARFTEVP